MSEEEKKAVEILSSWYSYNKKNRNKLLEADKIIKVQETILNLIENQQKELEKYKRLAEMNLKDSEEFKKNMCEHRCILNNQIMELTEELNNLKEIEKSHQEENGKLRVELEQEKAKTPETLRKQLELYQDRLYEEKEKNKELLKEYNKKLQIDWEDAISKDKIKEIYNILGEYRHYTTPTIEQNEENENAVDKAVNFIKELLEGK